LALVAQTVREFRGLLPDARFVAVCSDPSVVEVRDAELDAVCDVEDDVDQPDGDQLDGDMLEGGVPGGVGGDGVTAAELEFVRGLGSVVALDADVLAGELLAGASRLGVTVVVVTHVSAPVLAAAQDACSVELDVLVVDEAHRVAGSSVSAARSALLGMTTSGTEVPGSAGVRAVRRLFMTATPRVHQAGAQGSVLVASMDDQVLFGPVAFDLPFAAAVALGLLAPYEVALVGVTCDQWGSVRGGPTAGGSGRARVPRVTVRALNRRVPVDPMSLAVGAALLRAMRARQVRSVVSFHSRVWRARVFAQAVRMLSSASGSPVGVFTVSALSAPADREAALEALRSGSGPVLVSNARVLSEGVDVPALDAVLFADPRRSLVDVTQAVGRVMRTAPGKSRGLVILPVLLPAAGSGVSAQDLVESGVFAPVWELLRAVADLDVSLGAAFEDLRVSVAAGSFGVQGPLLPDRVTFDVPDGVSAEFMRSFALLAVRSLSSSWGDGFALLQAFALEHGHVRVPARFTVEGRDLDGWVKEQRSRFARGLMSADRVARLEGLPGWVWRVHDEAWERGWGVLVEFLGAHGGVFPAQSQVWRGARVGQWVSVQRSAFRAGRLDAQRAARLEGLPGWAWSPHEAAWERSFAALVQYVVANGSASPPPAYVTADGLTLGRWVAMARFRRERLDPVRVARLEGLPGWSWDPFADVWRARFALLLEHVSRSGSCYVPQGSTPVGVFDLATWSARQRADFRAGRLRPEFAVLLEGLPGWSWVPAAGRGRRAA
jgi:hypothetical protein